jgi:hypothetical protein
MRERLKSVFPYQTVFGHDKPYAIDKRGAGEFLTRASQYWINPLRL